MQTTEPPITVQTAMTTGGISFCSLVKCDSYQHDNSSYQLSEVSGEDLSSAMLSDVCIVTARGEIEPTESVAMRIATPGSEAALLRRHGHRMAVCAWCFNGDDRSPRPSTREESGIKGNPIETQTPSNHRYVRQSCTE